MLLNSSGHEPNILIIFTDVPQQTVVQTKQTTKNKGTLIAEAFPNIYIYIYRVDH